MREINLFLAKKFGIRVEKSSLQGYNREEWERFCTEGGLNDAEGAYMPRDYSAHFLSDSEFAMQSVFHEYFGHGLFIEHAEAGKELHNLEEKLMQEEAGIEKDRLKDFRRNNAAHVQAREFCNKNLALYEGFAMWMEGYLSSLTGSFAMFRKKFEMLSNEQKSLCAKFASFADEYGEYALLYSCGLPKFHNRGILENILRKMYKKNFECIEFALVYGSRKPYSDIDIFMVAENIECSYLGWIDVYSVSRKTFDGLVGKLDISITDPLFTGDFIFGNKECLGKAKSRILSADIKPEHISYHRQHAEKAKELAMKHAEGSYEHKSAMRYSLSYNANANELEKGNRPLTLKELIRKYPGLKK